MKKPDTQDIILWICIGLLFGMLTSCGSSENYEYSYTLIYTDATTEIVQTNTELRFVGNADCVSANGCGCTDKWCGVRKFDLISKKLITTNQPVKDDKVNKQSQYIKY